MTAKAVPLRAPRADIEALVARIRDAVYEDSGRVSICEALGALEVVKSEITRNELWKPVD